MRTYYNPPETYFDEDTQETKPFPPFEYEYNSRVRKFDSPHGYFKKEEEEYTIGILTHPGTGKPKLDAKGQPRVYKGKRDIWVPDEEKNEKMKQGLLPRPTAYLDLSRNEREFLRSAKFSQFTPHLVQEAALENSLRNDLEKRKAAHYTEMEELEKALEAQKQQQLDLLEQAKRQSVELRQQIKAANAVQVPKKEPKS